MKLIHDKDLDTVEIFFKQARSYYVSEVLPGVVALMDVITGEICSLEILFFSEFPDIWRKSMETLGYGYVVEFIDKEINNG